MFIIIIIIIIIIITFSLHQGIVDMSSLITHGQILGIHPLAHILGNYDLKSVVVHFIQFTGTDLPFSGVISHQRIGGRFERTQELRKNGCVAPNQSRYRPWVSTPYISRIVV